MEMPKAPRKKYSLDDKNYVYFHRRMQQILGFKEMLRQYDLDLIKVLITRFKIDGRKIKISEIEADRFNDILKNHCVSAIGLKLNKEGENEE